MNKKNRAREIQVAIRQILLREWDPIGVEEAFCPPDEYDSYVGGVYRLLASGAGAEALDRHLYHIETETMGLNPMDVNKRSRAVRRLLELDVTLG